MNLLLQKLKKNFYEITFLLIFLIFCRYFYYSFQYILGDSWAYNELFVNYSAGIIRRGLLGSIFIFFNEKYHIQPLLFFSTIFLILYSIQLILYYFILKNHKKNNIYLFIVFSPAIILFNIYDTNVYYVKDIFVNLVILFHCFYIIKFQNNFDKKKYDKFLLLFILPFIIFNLLNHEIQIFFLGAHILLTVYIYDKNRCNLKSIIYSYSIVLLPLLLLIFNPGSWEKITLINDSLKSFGVIVNNQLAGNMNLAIGGFLKWHFFFQDINGFVNFLICLILTILIFYLFFDYLINKKILKLNNRFKKSYLLFYLPSLALFILALDYGRLINLILTHLLAFYLILEIDQIKLKNFIKKIFNFYISKYLLFLFLLFYFFMWYLPQGGGYTGIGQFSGNSSILKSTLANEMVKIFMTVYDFIDLNIINLPRIVV